VAWPSQVIRTAYLPPAVPRRAWHGDADRGITRSGWWSASELRINSVLHVNPVLAPGTVVPIGWIAAGDPAQLFSPDRHDDLWAVQEALDFPGTMYGVPRGTPMRTIMRAQCARYGPAAGSAGDDSV